LFELITDQLTEDPAKPEVSADRILAQYKGKLTILFVFVVQITMEVESQEDGWLAKILVDAGDVETAAGVVNPAPRAKRMIPVMLTSC